MEHLLFTESTDRAVELDYTRTEKIIWAFNLFGILWSYSAGVENLPGGCGMRIKRSIMALLVVSALAQAALAQQGGPGSGAGPGTSFAPENFQEQKARILQMLDQRRSNFDKEKTCVEAAQNREDLQKCRPERPGGGMGPGPMRSGQGGSQGLAQQRRGGAE
jgi:hypothetical protein